MSVQYAGASGTGDFQAAPLAEARVPAGGYHLVRLAGGATGTPLPAPDSTGTLSLGASAGKVVLATGTTALDCNGRATNACSAPDGARIVDLVGFGGANAFEGTGPAPGLSSATAAVRALGGCTDANNADFAAATQAPRNATTAPAPCGTTPVALRPPS